ncbi:TPA: hypothetical protein N0F65_003926 [Lagenidium giganteum]|uniref:RING finger and CHY zinc finger domain-containing protein 1 n=1 Tax=Lagenidium giganteum TaxID=4803 RepID=A0AAV2Z774_9STRA|nr:TPA: hypothetical protein N0F65_003926 [Lagenidium giganteum]
MPGGPVAVDASERCEHYERGCRVLAECCKKWVGCRLCHDSAIDTHQIDRHAIREIECLSCGTQQPCAQDCKECGTRMASYFCSVCNLFDNKGDEKQIFHCDDCGICRVGGRENFFHCAKCCGCFAKTLENNHKCLEGTMHRECAICLEVTFDSRISARVLPCGHVMHETCFKDALQFGHWTCPTCREPLVTISDLEESGNDEDGSEAPGDEDDDDEQEEWETESGSEPDSDNAENEDGDRSSETNDDRQQGVEHDDGASTTNEQQQL